MEKSSICATDLNQIEIWRVSTSSSSKLNSEYYWQGSDRIHCACWFLYFVTKQDRNRLDKQIKKASGVAGRKKGDIDDVIFLRCI
jgi:hypothetical protein